jgi:hypothetical protein
MSSTRLPGWSARYTFAGVVFLRLALGVLIVTLRESTLDLDWLNAYELEP